MKSSKPVARGNEGERAREIRSLLTKLASGATLTRDGRHGFRLTAPAANSSAVPEDIVAAKLVEACLAQDWLEREGDALRLSHVGRAWLRRSEGDAFRAQHQLRGGGEREIDGTRRPVLLNEAEVLLAGSRAARTATECRCFRRSNTRQASACAPTIGLRR
jgi:hypothetical protein